MAARRVRSPYPLYAVAAVWVVWALLFPLYRLLHFALLIALSAGVYLVGRKVIWKDVLIPIPDPVPEPRTEEERAVAEMKAERDRAVAEMRRLNDAIADPQISAQIDHMEAVTDKIFQEVEKDPGKRPQIRRFLQYYLPTTLKLLNAYDRMDDAGVEGTNIDGAKGKIETILAQIVQAFDKQLDALFGAEALDISTDITVLEQMMAREGLGGGPTGATAPFDAAAAQPKDDGEGSDSDEITLKL